MRRLLVIPAVLAALAFAGCQNAPEKRDAHQTGGNHIDRTPAGWVVGMPDDYPNIAEKCDPYGRKIIAATHNGGHTTLFWVIEHAPECKGYKPDPGSLGH